MRAIRGPLCIQKKTFLRGLKLHLNDKGTDRAREISIAFSNLLFYLEDTLPKGREFAIVRTKLEEASFYAKKSLNHSGEHKPATVGTKKISLTIQRNLGGEAFLVYFMFSKAVMALSMRFHSSVLGTALANFL